MAEHTAKLTAPSGIIDFDRSPETYRHWKLKFDGEAPS